MGYVDIAVVGGGLAGLAVCVGLRNRGFKAHVYEAAPELRTSTSTVIGLSGNALKALDALDPRVLPELLLQGHETLPFHVKIYDRPGADPMIRETPKTATGNARTFRWAVIQNHLASLLPEEAIHCNHRATGYTVVPEEEHGGVVVHFRGQQDVRARFVVAADGVRSALRATLLPDDPGPRYLGQMNWNAMLWNPDNSVVKAHGPQEFRICIDADAQAGQQWSAMTYVIDTGSGYTFWQLRVMSPKAAFTNSHSSDVSGTAANGTAGKEDSNGDSQVGRQDEKLPQLVGGGLGVPGSKERVLHILREKGYVDVIPVVEATPESEIFERAMIDRIPLDELGAGLVGAGGRLVLLGDAAHAMHSGSGQGGRMAFEDSHQLVQAFERHATRLPWYQAKSAPHAASDGSAPAVQTSDNRAPAASSGAHAGSSSAAGNVCQASELAALQQIGAEYERARLPRVCRVQRYVLEGQGLPEYTEKARAAAGIQSPADVRERMLELNTWLGKYPECADGDPSTKWWKPPADPKASQAADQELSQAADQKPTQLADRASAQEPAGPPAAGRDVAPGLSSAATAGVMGVETA